MRGNGSGDAFGLREIEAAVEIRAGGELSRLGEPRPGVENLLEQHAREQRVPGDVELGEVFAGVAARFSERVNPGGDGELGEPEIGATCAARARQVGGE